MPPLRERPAAERRAPLGPGTGTDDFRVVDPVAQTPCVDGFAQSIGNGITGLVSGSFATIGQVLRGIVDALDRALPGGMLAAVAFVVLAIAAWQIIKR